MKRLTAVLAPALTAAVLVVLAAAPVAGGERIRHHSAPAPWSHARIVHFFDSGRWARITTARVRRARAFLKRQLAPERGRRHDRGRHRGGGHRRRGSHDRSRRVAFTGAARRDRSRDGKHAPRRRRGDLVNPRRLAIVFDIDDTLLSTYRCQKSFAGGFGTTANTVCIARSELTPIRQTISLLRYAVRRHVSVYLITGRPEAVRSLTIDQLDAAGIHGYRRLFLRPADDHNHSVIPYKSGTRRRIERAGHTIVVNVGDQWSDLEGGFSKRVYKIPNPMYFLP